MQYQKALQRDLDAVFPDKTQQRQVLSILNQIVSGDLHKVVYFYGTGSNGKTEFADLIRETFNGRSVFYSDIDNLLELIDAYDIAFLFVKESTNSPNFQKLLEIAQQTQATPIVCTNVLPETTTDTIVIEFSQTFSEVGAPYCDQFAAHYFFNMVMDSKRKRPSSVISDRNKMRR